MYPADPAQQLITAGEDLDDLSVDDLSVDDLSVAHVFWVGSRMTCMIYSARFVGGICAKYAGPVQNLTTAAWLA